MADPVAWDAAENPLRGPCSAEHLDRVAAVRRVRGEQVLDLGRPLAPVFAGVPAEDGPVRDEARAIHLPLVGVDDVLPVLVQDADYAPVSGDQVAVVPLSRSICSFTWATS